MKHIRFNLMESRVAEDSLVETVRSETSADYGTVRLGIVFNTVSLSSFVLIRVCALHC